MSYVDEVRHRATITVPEAGRLLGVGRDAAYAAAERGELPVLRLGRRLLVPVPRLLELLGIPQTDSGPAPSHGTGTATTSTLTKDSSRDQHAAADLHPSSDRNVYVLRR
jgi:excisionase family DNA binding protein